MTIHRPGQIQPPLPSEAWGLRRPIALRRVSHAEKPAVGTSRSRDSSNANLRHAENLPSAYNRRRHAAALRNRWLARAPVYFPRATGYTSLRETGPENGPLAVRKIKEGILRASGLPLDQAYQVVNEVSAAVMSSKDAREGPRAFKEKRKPHFTGE